MSKTSATLSDIPLLGSSPISWRMTEGVRPNIQTFDVEPVEAVELYRTRGPFTLKITCPDTQVLQISNLWVLNVSPSETPYISRITVADRRWFWSYTHIMRRFNMRRNVGVKRLRASNEFVSRFDSAPLVQYWKWSTNKGQPWKANEIIEDVFNNEIAGVELESNHTRPSLVVADDLVNSIRSLPIEELTIDDQGDKALSRILALIPEAGITVDKDGVTTVFSKASGREEELVTAQLPEIRGMGHTELVKNSTIRPKEIHVLFTREVEVRFDFDESTGATRTEDTRYMDNVISIPDAPNLQVGADLQPQGTWITMNAAFTAWGDLPNLGTPLTHGIVQRAFIPHQDLWEIIQAAGARPTKGGSVANWVGRIAEVQNRYRMTFRLNSRWVDRYLSARAYRATTIDPQSRQRRPSRAYGDYSIMYTQRSIWRNYAQGQPLDYVINKSAYPSSGKIDSTAEVSPADVLMVDSDQGIVHVEYKIDPNRVYEMILPSQVSVEAMPTADIRQRTRPITFDSAPRGAKLPSLSPNFKLATILTLVPASPNTAQQLHRVVVRPAQVRGLLPQSQQTTLRDAYPPIMEVRIGAKTEVARVQWLDSESSTIEQIFGITEVEKDAKSKAAFADRVNALTINQGTSALDTGASLTAIALAKAASIYGSLVDRYEGEMAGYLNGNIHVNGWGDHVEHKLDVNGVATTSVKMAETVPQFDIMSWLDSNSRAAILGLV